jgi:hypothetical protein
MRETETLRERERDLDKNSATAHMINAVFVSYTA